MRQIVRKRGEYCGKKEKIPTTQHFSKAFNQSLLLTLSAPWAKSWSFPDDMDQDHTAQNVQSYLDLSRPLVKSDMCGTIICGPL